MKATLCFNRLRPSATTIVRLFSGAHVRNCTCAPTYSTALAPRWESRSILTQRDPICRRGNFDNFYYYRLLFRNYNVCRTQLCKRRFWTATIIFRSNRNYLIKKIITTQEFCHLLVTKNNDLLIIIKIIVKQEICIARGYNRVNNDYV